MKRVHHLLTIFPELSVLISGVPLDFPGLLALRYFRFHIEDMFEKNPKIALV